MFYFDLLVLFLIAFFCNVACGQTCSANGTIELPGDLRLGACNGSTVCNFLTMDYCNNVTCLPIPGDCNIYTCINGICVATGVTLGCCESAETCDKGNPCIVYLCTHNRCTSTPVQLQCTRDFNCPINQYCTSQCNCSSNLTVNFCNDMTQCDDGNPCTIDTCDPDNMCFHQVLPSCCTVDNDCESITNPCYRVSFCNVSSNTCIFKLTDNDNDGIPCPEDCNDTNPSEGFPIPFHLDSDGDGAGTLAAFLICPNASIGFVNNGLDCNDGNPCMYTGNYELCRDGINNDCGNSADERNRCVDLLDTSFATLNTDLGNVYTVFTLGDAINTQTISIGTSSMIVIQNVYVMFQSFASPSKQMLNFYNFTGFQTGMLDLAAQEVVFPFIDTLQIGSPSRLTSDTIIFGNFIGVAYAMIDPMLATEFTGLDIRFSIPNINSQVVATDAIVNGLVPGYVVYGSPTICQTTTGNLLIAYEIGINIGMISPTYAIMIAKANTSASGFPYVWNNQLIVGSQGILPPNPIIRVANLQTGIGCVGGSNLGILEYQYYVCLTPDCDPLTITSTDIAVIGLSSLEIGDNRIVLDMISLYDGRPVMCGPIYFDTPGKQQSTLLVCFPPTKTGIFDVWICQQIGDEGFVPSLTLIKQRLFIGYWTTEQSLAQPNGPWSFNQLAATPKYATNCIPIPSTLAWNVFQLPQSNLLKNNIVDASNPGVMSPVYGAIVMPDIYTSNSTLSMIITNYLGIEIYG